MVAEWRMSGLDSLVVELENEVSEEDAVELCERIPIGREDRSISLRARVNGRAWRPLAA